MDLCCSGRRLCRHNEHSSGDTACLACLFPKPPTGGLETCDTAGILNTAVNLAASIEVTEALKLLVGQKSAMRRTLLSHDLWSNERAEVSAARPREDCTVCGMRDFSHLRGEGRAHITLCGRNSVQIHENSRPVDFAAISTRLSPHGNVRFNNLLLRFERGDHTITLLRMDELWCREQRISASPEAYMLGSLGISSHFAQLKSNLLLEATV